MHIYDNFLRHSGIVRYRSIECLIIESLNADHGIDFPQIDPVGSYTRRVRCSRVFGCTSC